MKVFKLKIPSFLLLFLLLLLLLLLLRKSDDLHTVVTVSRKLPKEKPWEIITMRIDTRHKRRVLISGAWRAWLFRLLSTVFVTAQAPSLCTQNTVVRWCNQRATPGSGGVSLRAVC
ncbi:hypothetical protein E2C01_059110 [Portunus trituberculatus]|uniref:Uncharacterized protein n=1 Tax=Portunus trituberculatus TaxID=210409 RepID=A0A5B7H6N9_PORTR|nr:hypothetical protein [Portunus trituberculatus]